MPKIRLTLEAALQHADMSGRELERRTGVHRDTIGKYRHNAVRMVSLDILEALCEELHCSLVDLLTDQPEHAAPRPSERPPAAPRPVVQPPPATDQPRPSERPLRPNGGDSRWLAAMPAMAFWGWVDAWHNAWEQARGARG